MKKIIIILLLAVSFGIPTFINAIDKFPEEIYVYSLGGSDGYRKKVGKYTIGTVAKNAFYYDSNNKKVFFKVICTTYNKDAPAISYDPNSISKNSNTYKFVKMAWNGSDADTNLNIAVAIGYIIKHYRSASGGLSWDEPNNNYFLEEMAINRYLYKLNSKYTVNKVEKFSKIPKSVQTSIDNVVDDAKNKVDEFRTNKDSKVQINSVKINKQTIQNRATVNLTQSNQYTLSATVTCVDKENNSINCNNLSNTIKIGGKNINFSTKKDGKKYTLSADITSIVKNKSNVLLEINSNSNVSYPTAQRYKRETNPSDVQAVTGNLLRDYDIKKSGSFSGTLNAPQSVTPPSNQITCKDELEDLEDLSQAYTLYYKDNDSDYAKENLLDINNPSCTNSDDETEFNCSSGDIKTKTAAKITVNSNKYDALCTLNYHLDNSVFDNASASKHGSLYKGLYVATASYSYDCNIPALKGQYVSIENYSIPFTKKSFPKLIVNIFGKKYELASSFSDSVNANNGDTNNYKFVNYSDTVLGFGFRLDGILSYSFKSSDVVNEGSGISVPDNIDKFVESNGKDDANVKKVNSILKIYYQGAGGSISLESPKCPAEIYTYKDYDNLSFRTIDTKNPFLKYDGEPRTTGDNWCANAASIEADESLEVESLDTNNKLNCIYHGDVNNNGSWDDEDVKIIKKYLTNSQSLSLSDEQKKYMDADNDGNYTINDATTVQKYQAYNSILNGDANLDGKVDYDDEMYLHYLLLYIHYLERQPDGNKEILIEPQKKVIDYLNGSCGEGLSIDTISELQKLFRPYESVSDDNNDNDANNDINDYEVNDTDRSLIESEYNNNLSSQIESNQCAYDNPVVETYITNRPDSNGVVNGKKMDKPLYTFVLDANKIKEIRSLNGQYNQVENSSDIISFINKYLDKDKSECSSYVDVGTKCLINDIINKLKN